jgi:hypothetical protein
MEITIDAQELLSATARRRDYETVIYSQEALQFRTECCDWIRYPAIFRTTVRTVEMLTSL